MYLKNISLNQKLLGGMIVFLVLPSLAAVDNELERPNILWFTYEDTSPQFIGCYGNEYAKTPAIDKLAQEGIRFTSAFSTGSISSPSRFCLITGMTPTTMGTGNHRSRYHIPDFVHGFPKYLREAGYYTTNNNKTDYNTAEEKRLIEESWDESSKEAGWWNRRPGQPFFAVVNSFHSHQSRTMTNPWEVYEKQILEKLDSGKVTAIDASFEMPAFYHDTPEMRRCMSRVYNSISLVDNHFESVMKRLEEEGLKENTIVFCFADHGEGIPRGKGCSLGLGYRVPFVLWVPEKYRHLSPWGAGTVTDQLVSFEDFAVTVLSIAGVEIPEYLEGTPFMGDQMEDEKPFVFSGTDGFDGNGELSRTVTDGKYLYTRVFSCHQPFVRWITYFDHGEIQKLMRRDLAAGLLDSVQSEILEPRSAEYLYDLEEDKWEVNNLASKPEYADLLNRFRVVLKQHLITKRDAHFIPEYTYSLLESSCIPYYVRENETIYPVEDVLHTAMLCGMGNAVEKEQIDFLEHPNVIVQYWAALGLFIQRNHLVERESVLKKRLLAIDYPPARMYLAGAMLECFGGDDYNDMIEDGLLSDNVELNQIGMQILLNLELDKARHFLPALYRHKALYDGEKGHKDVEYFMKVLLLKLENRDYTFDVYF